MSYSKNHIQRSFWTLLLVVFITLFIFSGLAWGDKGKISHVSQFVNQFFDRFFNRLVTVFSFKPVPSQLLAQTYVLSQNYTIENLGPLMNTNILGHTIMFRLSTGETHLMLHYWGTGVTQMIDLNLETGAAGFTNGEARGRSPGSNATVLHPNDKIYFGSGEPGDVMSYDPKTGIVQILGKLSDKATQYALIGDDSAIYFGSCCLGKVDRYDPATGVLESFGRMDDAGSTYQYAYTLGADNRYVYVGLGQSPWYLGIYDKQTGQKTLYWKEDNDTGGNVLQGVSGGWYYDRTNSAQPWYRKYYKLENGTPIEISKSELPPTISYIYRGNIVQEPNYFDDKYGYEVDLGDVFPDNTRNYIVVKWRKVGESSWQSATISNFKLSPSVNKRIYSWPGKENKLFGFVEAYGPTFEYDTVTGMATTLGHTLYSMYDTLFTKKDIYISIGFIDKVFRNNNFSCEGNSSNNNQTFCIN